jgi:hypothetical protein
LSRKTPTATVERGISMGGDAKSALLSPAFVRFALIGGWPLGSLCIFGLLVALFGRGG